MESTTCLELQSQTQSRIMTDNPHGIIKVNRSDTKRKKRIRERQSKSLLQTGGHVHSKNVILTKKERKASLDSLEGNVLGSTIVMKSGRDNIMSLEEEKAFLSTADDRRQSRASTFLGVRSEIKEVGKKVDDVVVPAPFSSSFECKPDLWDENDPEGRVLRKSGRLNFSYAECIGKRSTMEDAYFLLGHVGHDRELDAFGLFDGHGGDDVSKFAASYFPAVIDKKLRKHKRNPKEFIKKVFTDASKIIKEKRLVGGSTALVGLVIDNFCYIANLGDCRAIFYQDGNTIRVTTDHTPALEEEKERIVHAGGFVTETITREGYAIHRINGQLAVSRALGDLIFEKYISHEPDVFKIEFTSNDDFLIVACDGLWDMVEDEEATQICKQFIEEGDLLSASERLRDVSYFRGSTDNISVLVITPITESQIDTLYY
eukprot:TRINITY_DN13032_c0_g1_i1.p1 TRINITY_DN13032_c0_g1~~TRINITY_DN13032_c0_g1_i1.p1  ORF type:complete len:430 (+),score=70.71 TRINITY_DN13032_c0_g1_i1:50-1339(+)